VASYRIDLMGPDGFVESQRHVDFEDDDGAIDHAGFIDHPHEMFIWQGDRFVARFRSRR
jgi:hypothetical protein